MTIDEGIGSWPARRARNAPDRIALVQGDRALTYHELDLASLRLARGLLDRGVQRGDRIAYLGPNSIEMVEWIFAVAKLGAVSVPLNVRLAAPELRHILLDCQAKLLVAAHQASDLAHSVANEELDLSVVVLDDLDSADPLATLGMTDAPVDSVAVQRHDLFMIQYTSGTSGHPKGVLLSHANIAWNVFNVLADIDLRADEVTLAVAPLFHTAALNQQLFPTLFKGGTVVLEESWSPDRAIDIIEQRRVTFLFGVTTMYLALSSAARWADADFSSLRTVLGGGSPFPEALLRTFADRGIPIAQGYGLTEAAPGVTLLRTQDALRKLGSAGTPCFFTDLRLVQSDTSVLSEPGTGEIHVRGPHVTSGYWQLPKATSDALLDDGWLRTGDLAHADDDGFLTIAGRAKDMYISGGENVYPAEIEQVLYEMPDVAECAVIGVPDDRWGEAGRAILRLRPNAQTSEDDVLAFLAERLARYKVPKSCVFVSELPHNATGKLLKAELTRNYGA